MISTATGGSSRVVKYKHNFAIVYPLVPSELAIISLLLLRGPKTPGEINTNSGRLYEFETLDEVNKALQKLCEPPMSFIKAMDRRPGQKEVRYIHLLDHPAEEQTDFHQDKNTNSSTSPLEERVFKLEQQLMELKNEFDKLMKELS